MIYKTISVKEVIAKVYRDLNLTDADRWQDMIEWSAEALNYIGAYQQYKVKGVRLAITNALAKLPCDMKDIIQVAYNGIPLQPCTGSFTSSVTATTSAEATSVICEMCVGDDTNFSELLVTPLQGVYECYDLDSVYIKTSFLTGTIYMAYNSVATDEDGFPLVPDDESYKDALLKYIVMKLMYGKFVTDEIKDTKYRMFVRDWEVSCMQARGKANMPNLAQLENIKNQWVRIVPNINRSSNFFNDLKVPETLR